MKSGLTFGSEFGFHTVGNPYTAAIDARKFLEDNALSIAQTIWLWNHNGGGGYLTVNALGEVGGYQSGVSFNGSIGAAQGFFIQALSDNESITFSEWMRVKGQNSDNSYMRMSSKKKQKEITTMKLVLKGEGQADETLIGFLEDATEGWDQQYDATKIETALAQEVFYNVPLSLYTLLHDEPMATQGLPPLHDVFPTTKLKIGLSLPGQGAYGLSLSHLTHGADYQIFLEDKESGKMHDFARGEYHFDANGRKLDNRFVIWVNKMAAVHDLYKFHGGDNEVKVWLNDIAVEKMIRIYDLNGKKISESKVFSTKQAHVFRVPAEGIYIVYVISDDGQHVVMKVLVK